MERLVVDLTSFQETLNTFKRSLGLSDDEVHTMDKYFLTRERDEVTTDDILSFLGRESAPIRTQPIQLNSLHVTTNNDKCSSLLKLGIIDLQSVVTEETPLSEFLKTYGIEINIKEKLLIVNGSEFDLIRKTYKDEGYNEALNHIVTKLYKDSSVCGFVSSRNALDYGGGIRTRPEFMKNISTFLHLPELINEWERTTSTYIVKFGQPFENYDELNLKIPIDDILFKVTYDYINNIKSGTDIYSFLPQHSKVQPNQIIDIYSAEEYQRKINLE